MRLPTTRLRHRLQLGAAIVASVSSVWIVSRVLTHACKSPPPPPPAFVYVPAPPPPPLVPKVIAAPIVLGPHLTPAFSAAVREGDVKQIEATYTDESSLGMAMLLAASSGKRDVMKWLLDKGADVHFAEAEATSPLLEADAYPDVVQLLLDRGTNEAEILAAVQAGAPNAVGRILAKDKKAAQVGADETSLIVEAINSGLAIRNEANRTKIVEKLLAAGADADEDDPLAPALGRCTGDIEECQPIVKLLLAKHVSVSGDSIGAVIDLEDSPSRATLIDSLLAGKLTPDATAGALTHATGDRDAALIKRLASRGVAWTYHDGEADAVAPLVEAVERQDVALVRMLLDAGAPADHHYKDGRSALGSAIEGAGAQNGEMERIAELLVQRGANVNRRLPDGRPALFAAAESGDVRIVQALLSAGARVNERVLDETALDAAERSGNTSVARILDGHGARRAPARVVDTTE